MGRINVGGGYLPAVSDAFESSWASSFEEDLCELKFPGQESDRLLIGNAQQLANDGHLFLIRTEIPLPRKDQKVNIKRLKQRISNSLRVIYRQDTYCEEPLWNCINYEGIN